ncbi:MAG: hypothetical protein OEY41_17785 [Acidimicrobiia bacterium]|nr:hypothetical protein [Acidimicrobiia bacterium]MDH5291850.1 hypothetical protein [Acidimicrobiia bacterium]
MGSMIRDWGTLIAGLVLAALGIIFLTEAAGAWSFRLSHLALIGPLLLMLVGAAVLIRGLGAASRHSPD